jgi:hypothetical protein
MKEQTNNTQVDDGKFFSHNKTFQPTSSTCLFGYTPKQAAWIEEQEAKE